MPGYAITEITHSPYGLFLPRALDEDGDVLGGVMNCGTRPARYDAASGSYSILTPLPEDDAEAISAASDGTILVRDLNFWRRSYRWKDGVLESIGSLGGQRTYATAMNAAGWVVGWADLASGNGTPHAFLHDGTTMKDLGEGFANAVSGAGEIVGIKGQEAAVFESPTILLPIPSRAVAYDVSDTGVVVGSAGQGLDQKWPPLAFVYDLRTGSVTEVAPLPGDVTVTLVDVNRSGTLAVGGSGNREQARSVVWADGHLYDFSTYVGVQGAPTTIAVRDVNDRGQFLISSSIRYYVLTPR
ncbi:MAG TPA: hypothetical protein VFL83_05560 [Anaeromyxobacter sp.]|nr:hypothetical protein [Anaeromyxobacter sp.]